MTQKILFADDDPLVRQLYRRHIEQAGYEWMEATNGREAFDAVLRESPQVAVLDIQMPEKDGLSVMFDLKKLPTTREIPVILITSVPIYYSCRQELKNAGATAFLSKPFGPKQLIEAIHECLPPSPGFLPSPGP
jgi:CheY-like chemotaxis protein